MVGRIKRVGALIIALFVSLGFNSIASATSAVAAPTVASGTSITVPVHLDRVDRVGKSGYYPYVYIEVSGQTTPVKVMLDTGSSGLVLKGSKTDGVAGATLTRLFIPATQTYSACKVYGGLFTGQVNLMDGASTAVTLNDVPIIVGPCDASWPMNDDMAGVLGIGQGMVPYSNSTDNYKFASPFTHVNAGDPMGEYASIHFDSKRLDGEFTLGDGSPIAGGVTFASGPGTGVYHNGGPVYGHDVRNVCWAIDEINDCDVLTGSNQSFTTFDSGAPGGFVGTTSFNGLLHVNVGHELLPGTHIRLLDGNDSMNEWGAIDISSPSFALINQSGQFPQDGPPFKNNSGSGFLLDRTIQLDFATGHVTIGPLMRPLTEITLGIEVGDPVAGAAVDVSTQSLKPQEPFTVTVHSTPTEIAHGTVNDLGRVFATGSLPGDLRAGWHRIEFRSTDFKGGERIQNLWIQVSDTGLLLAVSHTNPELPNTGSPVASSTGEVVTAVALLAVGGLLGSLATLRRRRAR